MQPSSQTEPLRAKEILLAKLSLTISVKPVGVGTACQPWILAGEQSSLLTRIATGVLLHFGFVVPHAIAHRNSNIRFEASTAVICPGPS